MSEFPSTEHVYQAIKTLYHDPCPEKKKEADTFLISVQNSVHAWKIGDELLQSQTDRESCYFGAQLIKRKVMSSFSELPQDATWSLINSLMEHLKNTILSNDDKLVTTISLSIVDLTLQMTWWTNPVSSFLEKSQLIPPTALLEILRAFADEIDTQFIRLGANRRNDIENELSNCAPQLNSYINTVIEEDPSQNILLKALACFESWVPLMKNISDITNCVLSTKIFEILTNFDESIDHNIHGASSDLLCAILRTMKGPVAREILHENLVTKVAGFENAYHLAVGVEDAEKVVNYCRIFTELAETFLPIMTSTPKPQPCYAFKTMDLLLICTAYHDYEVTNITFDFWFALVEVLYQINRDELCIEFSPYIQRLIESLCVQVQMEPDSDNPLGNDDDFKAFRDKVCDLVRDSIFITGASYIFKRVFNVARNLDPKTQWEQLEAHFFIMYSIAWKISPIENDIIPQAMDYVFSFNEEPCIAIKYTIILLLGELRDWFEKHPNYLIPALEYLHRNLSIHGLADVSATSLCHICSSTRVQLKNNLPALMKILENLPNIRMANTSAIDIIQGVIIVMSQLPAEDVVISLQNVCDLQIKPLCQLIKEYENNELTNDYKQHVENVVCYLDRIGAIFKWIKDPKTLEGTVLKPFIAQTCASVFAEVRLTLLKTLDVYRQDSNVMERCCRCLRFAIRAIGHADASIIEPLVTKLVVLYGENQHCSFLYLASVIVDEYGNDPANCQFLIPMLEKFIQPTFMLLQGETGLRDHPDILDDLFRLCCRVYQKIPLDFLRSTVIGLFMECALAAVSVDHRDANDSVLKFLHEIFVYDEMNSDEKKEQIQLIYDKHGEQLIKNLLHAAIIILRPYAVVNIGEVLFDLIIINPEISKNWIALAVEQLPNISSSGNPMTTPAQIQNFLEECDKARQKKDISRALREFSSFYY